MNTKMIKHTQIGDESIRCEAMLGDVLLQAEAKMPKSNKSKTLV